MVLLERLNIHNIHIGSKDPCMVYLPTFNIKKSKLVSVFNKHSDPMSPRPGVWDPFQMAFYDL